MNAIERRNRRVRRLVVLKKVEAIEQKYCHVCPNRTSRDMSACKTCPIPNRLHELGEQLVGLSDRRNVEKIKEEPTVKYELKLKVATYHLDHGVLRKKRDPLTADEIIAGIAEYGNFAVFARVIGLPANTVKGRAYFLGLKGIKKAKAQEMMRMKEVTA